MANPRQRNKARSGRQTKPSLNQKRSLHQKLRRAPPLKGPQVLAESWDKKKTVFQNYAALGLLPSIPLPTGASSSKSHKAALSLPPSTSKSASSASTPDGAEGEITPKVSYGRIIRDDDGNVIDIILDDEEDANVEDEQEGRGAMNPREEYVPERVEAKTDVVRSLESLSATSKPVKRHTSTSEKEWLRLLVTKHGDDYEKMSRDKGLNVWQKTPGEIKRMVKKAGGAEGLSR